MARQSAERRARWTLIGIGGCAVMLAVTVALIVAHHTAAPNAAGGNASAPARHTSSPSATGWNVPAESSLANRTMPVFPPEDAQPHQLTSQGAGPPITLPRASTTVDGWILDGFPDTASGALAQLKALDESAMVGGDPAIYARAYRLLSLSGAPNPASTGLTSALTSFRAAGGLPETGPVSNLSVSYEVTEGLIKGSTDGGRYIVACVLGDLTVQNGNQSAAAGLGDCQALRWTGTFWRISPGPLAAPAPCAWPGTAESVTAGYRELS